MKDTQILPLNWVQYLTKEYSLDVMRVQCYPKAGVKAVDWATTMWMAHQTAVIEIARDRYKFVS